MNWLCPTTARAAGCGLGQIPAWIAEGGAAYALFRKKKRKKRRAPQEQQVFGIPLSQIGSLGPGGEELPHDPTARYQYLLRLRNAGWDYSREGGWVAASGRAGAVLPVPAPSPTGGVALPDTPLPAVGPVAPPLPVKDLSNLLIIGLVGVAVVAILPGLLGGKRG